jgi:hypothetical protein
VVTPEILVKPRSFSEKKLETLLSVVEKEEEAVVKK